VVRDSGLPNFISAEFQSSRISDHKRSFVYACLCSLCIKAGEFQWRFSLPLELAKVRSIYIYYNKYFEHYYFNTSCFYTKLHSTHKFITIH